eukprot:TRINITY_DN9486_c0_g1_i2.p1 TRINITY_DN9486_c0_g1~~TRINITY_DN9486_c0_g1_i2.p1  ORF type:complete len:156 (+),score=7.05 TRINITY_DN9486_c0_g1_i2:99-566(+)
MHKVLFSSMSSSSQSMGQVEQEIVDLNKQLLSAIVIGDVSTYEKLCDPELTAFEPEGRGHLIEGLDFHKYYLALARDGTERIVLNTMCSPKVKLLGNDAALITYIRLVQSKLTGKSEQVQVNAYQESRVWQKKGGQWVNVHFHRSLANADSLPES